MKGNFAWGSYGGFLAGSWRILGGTSASSRLNFGKFSAESRQVLGGPKNFQRLPKRQPEGGQKAPRMPKRRRKGCPKASKGTPKPSKNDEKRESGKRAVSHQFPNKVWTPFGSLFDAFWASWEPFGFPQAVFSAAFGSF